MKRKLLLAVGCCCIVTFAIAQSVKENNNGATVRQLNIGDSVPNIQFEMVNYETPVAKLYDFKEDLIILDFWSSWCPPCVQGFTKLDILQAKYKNRLKVILVNSKTSMDKKDDILKVFRDKKNVVGEKFNLPSAVNDIIATSLFKHHIIPHCVLIYKGKVAGITYSEYVTSESISDLLAGKAINLRLKKDYDGKADIAKTEDSKSNDAKIIVASKLTGYSSKLSGSGLVGTLDKATKLFCNNASLSYLFAKAYDLPPISTFPSNRYIYEIKNPSKFNITPTIEWQTENSYCYEITSQPVPIDSLRTLMQKDLQRLFDYIGRMEIRSIKCYVLRSTINTDNIITKGGAESSNIIKEYPAKGQYIQNWPMDALVSRLNSIYDIPILNEIDLSKNVDLKLPDDLKDINSLIESFKVQGIEIKEEIREIQVFVISDSQRVKDQSGNLSKQ